MVVAFKIIIDLVFRIVIIIIIIISVVVRKDRTLRPIDMINIISDNTSGPIIMGGRVIGRYVVVTIAVVMIIK